MKTMSTSAKSDSKLLFVLLQTKSCQFENYQTPHKKETISCFLSIRLSIILPRLSYSYICFKTARIQLSSLERPIMLQEDTASISQTIIALKNCNISALRLILN